MAGGWCARSYGITQVGTTQAKVLTCDERTECRWGMYHVSDISAEMARLPSRRTQEEARPRPPLRRVAADRALPL
jgi:hypothetical protein